MKYRRARFLWACAVAGLLLCGARPATAQVTQAAGYTPPDDTPKVNVGVTIFADYTYQDVPKVTDLAGQSIHQNSFSVSRAYINVTGSFSHWFSFRVTPDIIRDTSNTATIGNQLFRIKYAYGQVNFDDCLPRGSWFRFGLQQTPWIDYDESIYRYRFQGATFTDVEGFLISADYGATARVAFPENYGDIHAGWYNGDGYQSLNDQRGFNNQKGFMIRGSVRPAPGVAILRGLRLAGFYDADAYFANATRKRAIGNVTFEHPYVHAGFEYLDAHDRTTPTATELHRDGYSVWVTPRTPFGLEGLFRYDRLNQNKDLATHPHKERVVFGLAYWPPLQGGKTIAFMADYSKVALMHQATIAANTNTQIWALHTLFNW